MIVLLKIAMAAVLAAAAPEQQLGRARCRLDIERMEVALSGEVRLTLSIVGPEPVEVDLPRPLTASPDWRVKADPPRTTRLGGGHERWEQSFRLEPFQVGNIALALQPIRFRTGNEVRDRTLTWPAQTFNVTSSVAEVELGSARPIADVERLPPKVEPAPWYWYALAALVVAALTAIVLRGVRRRRAAIPALTARQRALAEIDALDLRPEHLPRVADALRGFLEDHFQLPATRQTTAEFDAALRAAGVLTPAQIEAVRELLARCDLVKFAGIHPPSEACQSLRRVAREVVASAGEVRQESSPASSSPRG